MVTPSTKSEKAADTIETQTFESVTLGDTNDVDHLILLEDGADGHALLKEVLGEGKLVGDTAAAVDLDLHDVGLLLAKVELVDLGVGNHTDDVSVVSKLLEGGITLLLAGVGAKVLGVLGESFFLGSIPVLVEATLDGIGKVLSKDSGDLTETVWGADVANNTDDNHGRSLDDGDSLNDFLLVRLGANTVHLTEDVCHTCLVAHEGGQVALLSLRGTCQKASLRSRQPRQAHVTQTAKS